MNVIHNGFGHHGHEVCRRDGIQKIFISFLHIPAIFVTTQVFRLTAEDYKLSRKARTKPFMTFSVSTTFGSSRDESSLRKKSKRFDKFS